MRSRELNGDSNVDRIKFLVSFGKTILFGINFSYEKKNGKLYSNH